MDTTLRPNRRDKRGAARMAAPRRAAARKAGRPAAAEQNSRDLLLDAASQLMNKRNTIDISLSELAAHSGLNSALVKYYFGNKEGLMLALLRRDAAIATSDLEHLLAMDVAPDAKLKLHIAAVITTFYRSPYLNRLLHAMLDDRNSETDSAKQIAEFFVKPFVRLQRRLLDQGVKAGQFRKVDPMFFYISVLGACDLLFNGRFTLRAVFRVPRITDELRERYIEHVSSLVLHGIAKRSRNPSTSSG
jgi:AcrR family transcriptional regulator